MSLSQIYISKLLEKLSSEKSENLIAQVDSRRVLDEVNEDLDNYPNFDANLTVKVTNIAYAYISCGCSLYENANKEIANEDYRGILDKAGKILYDTYKFNLLELENKDYNLLIAGMTLYASKQFSQAFIVFNEMNLEFQVGQIILHFFEKRIVAII